MSPPMSPPDRSRSFMGRLAQVPGLHWVNHARYLPLDLLHRRQAAPGEDELIAALKERAGGTIALSIAYNVPEAIALLADSMARFLPGTPLVVCDNSTDPAARAAIAAIARDKGLFHIVVPPGRLVRARTARSHAVAANWVFYRIVRKVRPRAFAYIDHDLVALAPMDLSAGLRGQPVYGMARSSTRSPTLYLWPGFAVFDGTLADRPLDFSPDRLLGSDTGGRNWHAVYKRLDVQALRWPRSRTVSVPHTDGTWSEPKTLIDGWLHVGGASYRGGVTALDEVRRAFDADPDGLLARLRDVSPPA